MSKQNVEQLLEERGLLLAELGSLPHMLHGSWVERYSVCSRPGCKCKKGERHGPRRYLVIRENGKQRQKYVPNAQVNAAREGVAAHHRALQIIERITQLNLALMKKGAYDD